MNSRNSMAELRIPHFIATLHQRVLFDVGELHCKTAFEPVGNCSGLMDIAVMSLAGGLLVLLWADHADLRCYQLTTSQALYMAQSEAMPWALMFVFHTVCKREVVTTRPCTGNWKREDIVVHVSDSMPLYIARVYVDCNNDCNSTRKLLLDHVFCLPGTDFCCSRHNQPSSSENLKITFYFTLKNTQTQKMHECTNKSRLACGNSLPAVIWGHRHCRTRTKIQAMVKIVSCLLCLLHLAGHWTGTVPSVKIRWHARGNLIIAPTHQES